MSAFSFPLPVVSGGSYIRDAEGFSILWCYGEYGPRAIAQAINCHDDLIYALRALLNANTRHEAMEPDWREALAQARVALAKAEGRAC